MGEFITRDGINTGMTREEWVESLIGDLENLVVFLDDCIGDIRDTLEDLEDAGEDYPTLHEDADGVSDMIGQLWEDMKMSGMNPRHGS